MKNIHITFLSIAILSLTIFSCKKAEEVVNSVLSENERLLMAKEWAVDWDKTYTGASPTATLIKPALQTIGTGRIKFESNKDLNYIVLGGVTTKKLGVWELTPVINQLKITGSDQTAATSIIPTTGEGLLFSLLQNSTLSEVTATTLVLTPGIGASLLGLGTAVKLNFKAAN